MASLFKRKRKDGSHVWYVAGYLNGKHFMQSTGTGDKRLALEVQRKIEEDNVRIEQGLKPAEKVKPILLSEFIAEYLENRRQLQKSPSTIVTDEYALRRLMANTGDCNLTGITDTVIRRYRDSKLKTLKPSSIAIELRHLRSAFSWAMEKDGSKYLAQNPLKQRGLMPVGQTRTIPLCLSPDEKVRFFSVIDDLKHKRLFQFLLLTGCRRSEALNLTWFDIDLEQKQIAFRKTKSRKDRTVPINLELLQVIMALDRSQPNPFNYDPDWVSHLFKVYLKKASIQKDLHLHCLRHTAASDLVRAGVHLSKIQKYLGHSSVKVTEIYTHVLPEDLREVADVLSCTG